MNSIHNNDSLLDEIWPRSRPIISTWDGDATEIFIIDLPISNLRRVLKVIQDKLTKPCLEIINGDSLDKKCNLVDAVIDDMVRLFNEDILNLPQFNGHF